MKALPIPSKERLLQLLSYDAQTGEFRWLQDVARNVKRGAIAGCIDKNCGYRIIRIDKVGYRAHRLAWKMHYGIDPAFQIDHINFVRVDNRIVNLRDVTHAVNKQNLKATAPSLTGLRGAFKNGRKFQSKIMVDGVHRSLGYFDTAEAAHAAYLAEKRIHHPGCTI